MATKKTLRRKKKTTKTTPKVRTSKATKQNFFQKFRNHKILFPVVVWAGVFIVSLTVVDFIFQYVDDHASAAIVNGSRISNGDYISKLERAYGSDIVSQLIDEELIHQEAEKQGVEIKQSEIDKEIKSLEDNYGGKDKLNEELENANITREEFERQIETTLIVREILGKGVEVTEEEKKDFYEQYKEMLFTDNTDPTYEESEEKIEEILVEQEISSKVQPWLEGLQKDANIQNNVDDPQKYGLLKRTRMLLEKFYEDYIEGDNSSGKDK